MKYLILITFIFSLNSFGNSLKKDCAKDLIKLCGEFKADKSKRRDCIKKSIGKVSNRCKETLVSRRKQSQNKITI